MKSIFTFMFINKLVCSESSTMHNNDIELKLKIKNFNLKDK